MLERVVELLRSARIDLADEKQAQRDIETLLLGAGIKHVRECRLTAKDVPDFMIDSLCVEVKLQGSKKQIYRQLVRYAKHSLVERILLVSCVSMGLPQQIEGKDTYLLKLGEAWL